jgi:hypothetical protein
MKTLFLMLGMLAGIITSSPAQVTLEVVLDQKQFLPGESLPVAVKITNLSGQSLHLGAEPNWLTFSVESADGFVVLKNAEVPVLGEFDLASSQMATKRVDLQPYFTLTRVGRYHIVATLRIKDWGAEESSTPVYFDVINGVLLWSQEFGLPAAGGDTGRAPDMRRYSLIKANYQNMQLRLFVQVSDPVDARIYSMQPIGPLVSFSQPEAQVDPQSQLHVLYQSSGSLFNYTVLNPDGAIATRELYDYISRRPRLGVDDQGKVVVIGGVRRLQASEMPQVKMPNEVQVPPQH